MARFLARSQPWELEVRQDWIDTTMGIPTLDPNWRGVDSNGHEHFYDKASHEYPTLDYIVDAEHWCEGNEGIAPHDPHMAVDEAHYECKVCREVVEPGVIPGGTPTGMPGAVSATLSGLRDDGAEVRVRITEAEFDEIQAADGTADPDDPQPTERDRAARRILNDAPTDRIIQWAR